MLGNKKDKNDTTSKLLPSASVAGEKPNLNSENHFSYTDNTFSMNKTHRVQLLYLF